MFDDDLAMFRFQYKKEIITVCTTKLLASDDMHTRIIICHTLNKVFGEQWTLNFFLKFDIMISKVCATALVYNGDEVNAFAQLISHEI